MSSGLTKKLSGLSASFVRIDGSSTIPSMMISETWIFDGPSERARDSARPLSRLGRSKCCRLGADEDNVPSGAPLHRRDDAARGGKEDAKVQERWIRAKISFRACSSLQHL